MMNLEPNSIGYVRMLTVGLMKLMQMRYREKTPSRAKSMNTSSRIRGTTISYDGGMASREKTRTFRPKVILHLK